jgi:hypothetical protein
MTLPCIWYGLLTLYQCPGNRGDLENNWGNSCNSRNYPCNERHQPGMLHLQLEMVQFDAGYVRVPITLTVADVKNISAVLQAESASRFVGLSAPCTSPRLVRIAIGCIYQLPPGNLSGLLISMQNYLGPDKKGIETFIFMCDDDVKAFLKVDGEITASLKKLVQTRAPQRKKYHQ